MFKRKKSPGEAVQEQIKTPPKSVAELEAERAIARGKRIESLASEAAMWRKFAEGCKPGRYIFESHSSYVFSPSPIEQLSVRMDEDTALLWAAFAVQMADERERRLKDVLGV